MQLNRMKYLKALVVFEFGMMNLRQQINVGVRYVEKKRDILWFLRQVSNRVAVEYEIQKLN